MLAPPNTLTYSCGHVVREQSRTGLHRFEVDPCPKCAALTPAAPASVGDVAAVSEAFRQRVAARVRARLGKGFP